MDGKQLIKKSLPQFVINLLRKLLIVEHAGNNTSETTSQSTETPQAYWTKHNVTQHKRFSSVEESLSYFHWRNAQYFDYIRFMPVDQAKEKVVLDYGCGPGHDLVGFAVYSKPKKLIGMEVSATSLEEAAFRLKLHDFPVMLMRIDEGCKRLPIEDASVDLIHCSGVLHHTSDPILIMKEFKRILKPDGYAQIMVYNYDSIFMHLHTAYITMIEKSLFAGKSKREAFSKLTDGPDCPIAECYKHNEFQKLASTSGFRTILNGVSMSVYEMSILGRRFDAILDQRFDKESRDFLCGLEFNCKGFPLYSGNVAGVDGCYLLYPS